MSRERIKRFFSTKLKRLCSLNARTSDDGQLSQLVPDTWLQRGKDRLLYEYHLRQRRLLPLPLAYVI